MIGRISLMVLLATTAGCQGATTQVAETKPVDTKVAATAPASQPAAVGVYTHEEAVKLYRAAKYKQAEMLCLKAIKQIEESKAENATKSPDLASPLDDLATVYLRLAKYNEAKPVIERAESVLDKSKPVEAILLGRLAINKGWRVYALGDVRAAEKIFVEGRDLIQKNQKQDSLELAELINNIGLMYDDPEAPGELPNPKRVTQSRVLLLKGWQMRKQLVGEESAENAESLNNIGMHFLFHGDGDEAIETAITTLKKALDISEKIYGAEHPETAMSHVNLALGLQLTDDDAGAEEHVKKAMPMTEKFLGKDHPDRAYELQILGQIEAARGNFKEAEAALLEAVRIYEVTYGADHSNVASPLGDLRELYDQMGEETKQKTVQKRIEKLRGKEI